MPRSRILSRSNPAARKALSQSPKIQMPCSYKCLYLSWRYPAKTLPPFVDFLNGSNPFGLAVWVIARARTLQNTKCFRDQLVRGEMIFRHVHFAVSVML